MPQPSTSSRQILALMAIMRSVLEWRITLHHVWGGPDSNWYGLVITHAYSACMIASRSRKISGRAIPHCIAVFRLRNKSSRRAKRNGSSAKLGQTYAIIAAPPYTLSARCNRRPHKGLCCVYDTKQHEAISQQSRQTMLVYSCIRISTMLHGTRLSTIF